MAVTPEDVITLPRPFGQTARELAIKSYLRDLPPGAPTDLWKAIYGLLLWIDPTTGLAHCYESDKSQPGRHWYPRTLAFHKWVSDQFEVRPRVLYASIDFMFKQCLRIRAVEEATKKVKQLQMAERQFAAFKDDQLPEPGENPELEKDVQALVFAQTGVPIAADAVRAITEKIQDSFRRENKRKNLLGEGFEDCLSAILHHAAGSDTEVEIHARRALSMIPGFRRPAKGDKERTVDLVIVKPPVEQGKPGTGTKTRTLMTVKWSLRADREEQFGIDLDAYSANESSGEEFDFAFVSNEFDAARLLAACNRKRHAKFMFAYIVHVCPRALEIVHADSDGSWPALKKHIESGRLIGIDEWLVRLGLGERGVPALPPQRPEGIAAQE